MALFGKRVKSVDYETEGSLPPFHVDVNGFLLFDDPMLGGCGILEVTPLAMTPSFTHRETENYSVLTDKPGYYSKSGRYFGDRRQDIMPQWVALLNGLLPRDETEDQTHVQILIKKTHPAEWSTRYTHAVDSTRDIIEDFYERSGYSARRGGSRVMTARANDYARFLLSGDSGKGFQNASEFKMYLVVSYTPSGEGWWLDGRDSDYYVNAGTDPSNLFDFDKFADAVADFFVRRAEKKRERAGNLDDDGAAEMLFEIDDDRTAQILETRIRNIELRHLASVSAMGEERAAFSLRRLHMVETTALIAFFNNPLSRMADKIYEMGANYNDITLGIDSDIAVATDDSSYLPTIGDAVVAGTLDLSEGDESISAYLSRYKGADADEMARQREIRDAEYEETLAEVINGDRAGKREPGKIQKAASLSSGLDDVWESLGVPSQSRQNEGRTVLPSDAEEAYLARFRRRNVSNVTGGYQGADDSLTLAPNSEGKRTSKLKPKTHEESARLPNPVIDYDDATPDGDDSVLGSGAYIPFESASNPYERLRKRG